MGDPNLPTYCGECHLISPPAVFCPECPMREKMKNEEMIPSFCRSKPLVLPCEFPQCRCSETPFFNNPSVGGSIDEVAPQCGSTVGPIFGTKRGVRCELPQLHDGWHKAGVVTWNYE